MPNLLNRIKNSIEADFHSILDQKEEKNPISLLNHYLRQCEREVEKARKLVERQSTLLLEFRRELDKARRNAEKRAGQAVLANEAGEAELYEFAKQEQLQYEERANHLSQLMDEADLELKRLEQKYEKMKHKLKDMSIKRMELMGKENSVRAHHKMDLVLEERNLDQPFNRFDEMESYIEQLEKKVNRDYAMSTIDTKFHLLEKKAKKQETNSNS
ncbi:PspA/IM30 family protein [Alkalihalobacillus hwajinpoensis]|uniref:PspA/IM30 family protein n=1 Tax=Guptibacillus hwajinpoensis TaxID=208199 RepID=UPI001883143D|nr:PspA/IM30 family protein [Pseudalkalibacillus hwajinpoensis]MBF0707034.1 PspA/IM30 family protein [Pseudalkalibacillus hwajinpoensis]